MQAILKSKIILPAIYICFSIITIFFYLMNYPLFSLDQKFYEIFCIILLCTCAYGTGGLLLKIFIKDIGFGENIVFSTGLGLGFYSLSLLILGLLKILYPAVIICFILLSGIISYKEIKNLIINLKEKSENIPQYKLSIISCLILIPALVFFITGIVVCFAPPTYYDSLVYHLAIPGIYLREHAINKITFNFFSNFPENIEMLFTIALALKDDIIANLLSFVMCIFVMITMLLIGKRFLESKSLKMAAMLFLITPSIILLGSSTYIETGLCFYLMLALLAYIKYTETENDSFLILSGIFSGLALGTKYIAGMGIICLLIIMMFEKRWQKIFKFLIISGIVFMPWALKNLFFTGDPVFPFLQKYLSTLRIGQSTEIVNSYFALFNQYSIQSGFFHDLLKFPYSIVTEGQRFAGGFDVLGGLGWVTFVIFLPTIFFINKFDKITIILCIYSSVFFLFWFVTGQVLRFLVPLVPVLCLLCANGINNFVSRNKTLNKTLITLLTLLIVYSNIILITTVFDVTQPFKVALGLETNDEYLSRKLNYYPAVKFINEKLPDSSKILFLGGEQRGYYCNKNYYITHPFAPNFYTELLNTSPDHCKLYNVLRQQGFTHLFLNLPEVIRLQGGPSAKLSETGKINNKNFIREFTKTVYAKDNAYIFEIVPQGIK